MKKKLLFIPFLTALAFAGCSNDDLTPGNTTDAETGDLRYLAVNIVAPKESANAPMGRAANGSFQDGTIDEDAVTSALFIPLNNENKVVQPQTADLNPWNGMGSTTGSVENISSAVLVINGQKTKPTVTGILAILNPTDAIKSAITAGMTLDAVKDLVADYGTTDGAKNSFVMTNSAYVDASNAEQLAAAVTDANLAVTADAAKSNPVEVYVERVVAKITTNAVADITTVGEGKFNQGASVTMNGATTATDLKIAIRGIQIANCAKKSYLFKNIGGLAASAPFANWSDATNHRSYWANVPELTQWTDFENHSWNEISGEGTGNTAKPLTAAQTFYAQENICNDGIGAGPGHTSVIVTAQLQKADGTPFNLVKLASEYYTPEGALQQLAGYLNSRGYRVKTTTPATEEGGAATTTYASLDVVNCLEWLEKAPTGATNVKGWEGFAQLKSAYATGKVFAKYDANSTAEDKFVEVSANDINTVLKGEEFRALKWTNGYCYYFVDIEHFGTKTAEGAANPVKLKGIIRNHIYSLNLQSLSGLGIPVFDPTVDIIPERPGEEQMFYLAARINILPWVLVNQNVNFN